MTQLNFICKVCAGENFVGLFHKNIHRREYDFIKCADCGFITIKPYPSQKELNDFFKEEYNVSYMAVRNSRIDSLNRHRLSLLLDYKREGNLLDIGCGSGIFLDYAKQYFSVEGIEKSSDARKIGRDRFDAKIIGEDLYEFSPSKSYDVITMFHVLEHVIDPNLALNKIYNMLKGDGVALLVMPNNSSLSFRIFGKHWEWLNPPKHLSYFTPKTIVRILQKNGFEIVELKTQRGDDFNFLFNSILAVLSITGIRQFIFEKYFSKKNNGNKGFLDLYELIFRITNILTLPFYPLRRLLENNGLGSEMVVVVRKNIISPKIFKLIL